MALEEKEIKVVDDQRTSPTFTEDLASGIHSLVGLRLPYGAYHLTNTGNATWYEFASEIFRQTSMSPNMKAISTKESGTMIERPKMGVLTSEKLRKLNFPTLPTWQDALGRYLSRIKPAFST
jgi:dTDP-4-dehydrorhamnose reductase